jgi:hypothetical protein
MLHPAAALQWCLDWLSACLGDRRRTCAVDCDGTARGNRIGYAIAAYIAFCALVSIAATIMMPDNTNSDISQEHA